VSINSVPEAPVLLRFLHGVYGEEILTRAASRWWRFDMWDPEEERSFRCTEIPGLAVSVKDRR